MLYLINPATKKKGRRRVASTRRRTTRKKRRTPAQQRATRKMIAARKRKLRAKNPPSHRRATTRKRVVRRRKTIKRRRVTVAAKRRRRPARRTVRRRRPAAQRAPARRQYRRNPARLTARGIGRQLTQGVQDAAVIVVGKGITNTIANVIPTFPGGGMAMDVAKRAAAAIGAGLVARQFMSADQARLVLAGGLTAPIEAFIKSLNIPIVSQALGFYDGQGYYAVGAYPQLPPAVMNAQGIEAYPMAASLAGIETDEAAYYQQ